MHKEIGSSRELQKDREAASYQDIDKKWMNEQEEETDSDLQRQRLLDSQIGRMTRRQRQTQTDLHLDMERPENVC